MFWFMDSQSWAVSKWPVIWQIFLRAFYFTLPLTRNYIGSQEIEFCALFCSYFNLRQTFNLIKHCTLLFVNCTDEKTCILL